MNCFRHHQSAAVGTCKYCFKGVCAECANDTGIGLACSPQCQEEVKSVKALMDRSRQAFPFAAKTYFRNAILLALFGVVFFGFGFVWGKDSGLFGFFLATGSVMAIGAIFSFLAGRRYSRPASGR
jgi:hypothetical protein